jgi:hypothetical protein
MQSGGKNMIDASWVIVSKETGKPVLETYDFELCQFVNIKKYRVVPILYWLQEFNRNVKGM